MFLIEAVEEPVLKESRAQRPTLVARGAEVEGGVDLAVIGGEEGGGGSAVEEEVGLGDGGGVRVTAGLAVWRVITHFMGTMRREGRRWMRAVSG